MRRRDLFLGGMAAAAHTVVVSGSPREEWIDVTGSPFPGSCWRWETDGVLAAQAPLEAFRDLRSAIEVADFEFRFECRLGRGANSGVKYLLGKVDAWRRPGTAGEQARARGFELQLIDDENAEDARRDPSHVTGSLYGILPPNRPAPPLADGQFHAISIRRRGPLVEHRVDGALVLSARLDDPAVIERCRLRKMPAYAEVGSRPSAISLQHHNSPVWFRRLQLRAL